MGVPALFRWLSKKYPKIVEPVREDVMGMSHTNPNGIEFDNLYLDMNGIVHPCTHPEGKKPPETEEDMMVEIFNYTERVVNMVRPRKLLMIAIDGVAPRAKMNQQRSRRFRAAQEAKVKEEEKAAAILEWETMGVELSEEYMSNKKPWDSNAITPGTPFMTFLTNSLRYWIVHKMNTDPGWKKIQVILSDSSVPGEGEHKIMDFVRRQRTQPNYDPSTSHVIYGLDADLIMLALATHEPNFKVLREDVFADEKKKGRGCHTCGIPGHHSSQCQADKFVLKEVNQEQKPFIFLNILTLRSYLAKELNLPNLPFQFDLERAIDDWVLLIFFVGNDFLPHLPSLDIREGAVDTLLGIWKLSLAKMRGYLSDCGELNLQRTEIILKGLADREEEIFRNRQQLEQHQDREGKRRRILGEQNAQHGQAPPGSIPGLISLNTSRPISTMRNAGLGFGMATPNEEEEAISETELIAKVDGLMLEPTEIAQTAMPTGPSKPAPLKMLGNNLVEQEDTVRLWEPGYQERYYQQKFGIELSNKKEKRKIVQAYVEGLAWVLAYYYQGCRSWNWFYPYHYSPFAADFTDLKDLKISFKLGQPSTPYEQLMGVFPASSRHHIPSAFHALMVSDDSPIKHFYPEEFEVDMNGKKRLWQGIALLPFIEQDRLLDNMKLYEHLLTDDDKLRLKPADPVIFCGDLHPQYLNLLKMYRSPPTAKPMKLNPKTANGVFGAVQPHPNCIPNSTFHSPLLSVGMPDISNAKAVFAQFLVPKQIVPHRSVLLHSSQFGKRVLHNHDRDTTWQGSNIQRSTEIITPYRPPHPSTLPHPTVLRTGASIEKRILTNPSRAGPTQAGHEFPVTPSIYGHQEAYNPNQGHENASASVSRCSASWGAGPISGQTSHHAHHLPSASHTSYNAVPPPPHLHQLHSLTRGRGRAGRGGSTVSHAYNTQYNAPRGGSHASTWRGSEVRALSSVPPQVRPHAVQPPWSYGGNGPDAAPVPAHAASNHGASGAGWTSSRPVSYGRPLQSQSWRSASSHRAPPIIHAAMRSSVIEQSVSKLGGHESGRW